MILQMEANENCKIHKSVEGHRGPSMSLAETRSVGTSPLPAPKLKKV